MRMAVGATRSSPLSLIRVVWTLAENTVDMKLGKMQPEDLEGVWESPCTHS